MKPVCVELKKNYYLSSTEIEHGKSDLESFSHVQPRKSASFPLRKGSLKVVIQLTTLSIFCVISSLETYGILRSESSIRLFSLVNMVSSSRVVFEKISLRVCGDLGVVRHLCIIKRL